MKRPLDVWYSPQWDQIFLVKYYYQPCGCCYTGVEIIYEKHNILYRGNAEDTPSGWERLGEL